MDPDHRSPVRPHLVELLASHRGTPGEDVPPREDDHREDELRPTLLGLERQLAGVPPAQRDPVGLRGLVGDVRAGVRGTHHQNRSGLEVVGTVVLARVQLADRRVELVAELRDVRRLPEGPGRHDHVVAGDRVVADANLEAAVGPLFQGVDPGAHPHRQVELQCVALEEGGDLVLLRERPRVGREGHAGQPVVLRRAVEPQGVPVPAPVVADPGVAVQDDAGAALLRQVVRRGQAGLTGSDDHGLDVFGGHGSSWRRVMLRR